MTYAFGNGLAVFANASLNSAKAKGTDLQVAKAPKATAAAGILYKHGPVKFSLIDKCPSSEHLAQSWWRVNGERASSGVGF